MAIFNEPGVPELWIDKRQVSLSYYLRLPESGMSEEAYRNHMVNVSAPMTKDLMVKYGVKRWTQVSKFFVACNKTLPSFLTNSPTLDLRLI